MSNPLNQLMETEGFTYYDVFQYWVGSRYFLDIDNHGYCILKFDVRLKKWFKYKKGYYQEIPLQDIKKIYYECMDKAKIPTSNQKCSHCIQRLEVFCLFDGNWFDSSKKLDNVLNGIVNLETRELIPHHPEMMFKYQIPRNFIVDIDPVIPPKFELALKCIKDETDRDNFLKFWLAVIHKIHDYEIFLMCYGVKWGGKSSLLNIFQAMYGRQVVGKKPLVKISRRFGLSSIYDKRINIHADMPIVNFDPFTISLIKTLTGEDGDIEVEIKGLTPFTFPINCFFAFGINQLMEFKKDAEKEIDSIMRRVVLVEFPTVQKINTVFKKELLDDDFLDELYSWFVVTKSNPLFYDDEQESWIQRNKQKWFMNSNPILKILLENYIYTATIEIEGSDPIIDKIFCREVVKLVKDELELDGQHIPSNLKGMITHSFSSMNIYPNTQRVGNQKYLNVVYIGGDKSET